MQYRALGNTGMNVSTVVYGGIVSAQHYDGLTMPGDGQALSDHYVSWAVDRGVNYFDVAPAYGDAQEKLGCSLEPWRKKVYLACKTGRRDRAGAEEDMRQSLRLLRTDYFDVYQLHAISTERDLELAFGPGGAMELLRDMKEKGLARKVGITAHSQVVAIRALEMYDFDTVLFPYNWHMHMAHGMGGALLKKIREKGAGALCMKSMIERAWREGERQESKYPKSWCKPIDADGEPELLLAAMKYVLELGVDAIVPPGNFDHFRFAVEHIDRAVSEPLTDAERGLLESRLETVRDRPFFGPDSYEMKP